MKTTERVRFGDMTSEERLARADGVNGTWQTYFSDSIFDPDFEDNANRKAAELGGEIDWTVVALDEFIQRAFAEGMSWAKVREFALTAIAQYEAPLLGRPRGPA